MSEAETKDIYAEFTRSELIDEIEDLKAKYGPYDQIINQPENKVFAENYHLTKEIEELKAKQGWRDIKDAPKDGTEVDLWVSYNGDTGQRFEDCHWGNGEWVNSFTGDPIETGGFVATHFMHLPSPPDSDTEQEGD